MGLVSADWVIREAAAVDPSLVLPLFNMTRSDPVDLAGFLERRSRFSSVMHHEQVLEVDGMVVGWGVLFHFYVDRPCHEVLVAVHPEYRRKGFGSLLLERLSAQAVELGATELRVDAKDRDEEVHQALERRGFAFHRWMFKSDLALEKLDVRAFEPIIHELEGRGFEFHSMAELAERDGSLVEWAKKAWEIEYLTDADIPGVELDERMSWEQYQEIVMSSPHYRPNAMVFALKGDEVVGMASLIEIDKGKFYNSSTCVRREHRGNGLATALKVLALARARDLGGQTVRTNNDSENAPMLAVNDRLGYVRQPGFKVFSKFTRV